MTRGRSSKDGTQTIPDMNTSLPTSVSSHKGNDDDDVSKRGGNTKQALSA